MSNTERRDRGGGHHGFAVAMGFHPKLWDTLCRPDHSDLSTRKKLPRLSKDPTRIAETVKVVVAASTEKIDSVISQLFWFLFSSTLVVLLIVPGFVCLVINFGFIPLQDIADKIENLSEEELDQRIPNDHVPEEILPIVKRLNGLLDRVETMVVRERSFSANVAHELRTPLSGIRSSIEVCLRKPRESQEYEETLTLCLQICQQSQKMVSDLLEISQVENHQLDVIKTKFDLCDLFSQTWNDFEEVSKGKLVESRIDLPSELLVSSDIEKVRIVVRNLIENAVQHCNHEGQIQMTLSKGEGTPGVVIRNTGNQVLPAEADLVFDRFWKGDKARTDTGSHFGLGLYLVKSLCDSIGARVSVEASSQWFEAKLSFPEVSV